jgi:hypothetical protein
VNQGGSAAALPATAATTAGLTVSIDGTDLAAAVDGSGHFDLSGVPAGDARLRFSGGAVNATTVVSNVVQGEQIQIQVTVSGDTAVIVNEVRVNGKIQLCHRSDDRYHLIEVSTNAEAAHRGHGDGKVGDHVPGTLTKVFDSACQVVGNGITIEKSTNGRDADVTPGPSIPEGDNVIWEYLITNNRDVSVGLITVSDNRLPPGAITCSKTSLAARESMTCEARGVAALGQYENVGTVEAQPRGGGGPVTDSDPSHYLGVVEGEEVPGQKIRLCHKTGNGRYHMIEVSINAERAHRAHGDGMVGETVPGNRTMVFSPSCGISPAPAAR